MADLYELVLTIDLTAGITDDELAELRWHVGQGQGQGPAPERLPIGTGAVRDAFPLGDPEDPGCVWEYAPLEPLFAGRGGALRVGGSLVAELVERDDQAGWALTVRQELHPDGFPPLRALLEWLGPHSVHARESGIPRHVGYLRFHENTEPEPLVLMDGRIRVPAEVAAHTDGR